MWLYLERGEAGQAIQVPQSAARQPKHCQPDKTRAQVPHTRHHTVHTAQLSQGWQTGTCTPPTTVRSCAGGEGGTDQSCPDCRTGSSRTPPGTLLGPDLSLHSAHAAQGKRWSHTTLQQQLHSHQLHGGQVVSSKPLLLSSLPLPLPPPPYRSRVGQEREVCHVHAGRV